jgi:hypothetical protein
MASLQEEIKKHGVLRQNALPICRVEGMSQINLPVGVRHFQDILERRCQAGTTAIAHISSVHTLANYWLISLPEQRTGTLTAARQVACTYKGCLWIHSHTLHLL